MNFNSDHVTILFGQGDGTMGPPQTVLIGSAAGSLVVGDFNQDSIPDLATTRFTTNTVSVVLGNGDGTFGPPLISSTEARPSDLVVADFDEDGRLDVAVLIRDPPTSLSC